MRRGSGHGRHARGAVAALLLALLPVAGSGTERAAPIRALEFVRPDPAAPPVVAEKDLRRWLRPVLKDGCDPAAARDALERRYRFLGYVPRIEARCVDGALDLSIRESSHTIARIAFDAADLIRLGLRIDPAFEDRRRLHPVPPAGPRPALRALLRTREGDLYNHERYRADRQALERLGYTLAFVPLPPGDVEYPAGAYLVQSLTPPGAEPGAPGRRRNYLGGNASHGPRRGTAVGATYQRQEIFGRLDRLGVAPLYNASLGGQLSYVAPLLADRDDPAALFDLAFDLYSDFVHNRLLQGIVTDQRTTGASAVLGIRPAGVAGPHDLRFEAGLRHERLDLEESIPGEPEEDLSALRLGATWTYRHTDRWPSLTLRLAPGVDVATSGAGGGRSFVRPGLEANLHVRHPAAWEFDLRMVTGTLDRSVPSFEQWSLGGAASVRGFREDFALGRHLAALQAELWFPLARPLAERVSGGGSEPADPGAFPVEGRAARHLKGALVLDGGYVSGTADGGNVTIAGAGIGLRFLVPRRPIVVKIDYAWGLGGRGGDGFPYVALGYRF